MYPFVLPEYCPEEHGAARPLMLLMLSESEQQQSIEAVLHGKKLPCQYRFFSVAEGRCLALLGSETASTDQFFRSIVYALQDACGEDSSFPDILETRLVPISFDLYPERGGNGAKREKEGGTNILAKYDLCLAHRASFGSGLHPSTQIAIALLEDSCDQGDGLARQVLDVGCGSGILSLVCARLGASSVHAVDRDPEAVAATRQNIAANKVEAIVRAEDTPVSTLRRGYDLVVANLAVSVLHGLLEDLCRLVTAEGGLVLSGFQVGQGARLRVQLEEKGFALVSERLQGGWLGFLCRRERKERKGKKTQNNKKIC